MKSTYQYRFYPDTKQKLELNEWLRIARYWYNRQLGDRFDWWEMNRTRVDACPLVSSIAALREKPNFYSQKKQIGAGNGRRPRNLNRPILTRRRV